MTQETTPNAEIPAALNADQTKTFWEQGPEAVDLAPPEPEQLASDKIPSAEPHTEPPAPESPKQEPEKRPTVDVAALHAERQERRKAEAELHDLREKAARMEGALQAFLRQQGGATPQQAPDVQKDPVAYFNAVAEKQAREMEAMKAYINQRAEAEQRAGFEQQIMNVYRNAANQFAQSESAFADAYGHWSSGIEAELQSYGYTPEAATERATAFELEIVARSLQDGVNPAERIFQAAKQRGWVPKQTASVASPLGIVAQGQRATGAGTTSAGGTGGGLTLEALNSMSAAEIAKLDWSQVTG